MTTQPTDEGKPLDENLNQGAIEEADFVEDVDPMIAEMKAAEAEIAAAAGTQPPAEAKGPADNGQPEAPAAGSAPKGASPMVPIARLNEVLSERDLLRDQVGYLRGLNDAKASNAAPAAPAAPADRHAETSGKDQGGVVDEVEAAISKAEEKKLELAERYDNGEISSKQWKQEEITIDKEIRALSSQRIERIREESRIEAQNAVQANNFDTVKNNVGLQLQAKHPNVAVIDSMAPAVSKGVWEAVTDQAAKNLAAQGIKVSKDNPQSQLMLIQEKARLTDNLEAFIPGFKTQPSTAAPTGPSGPKVPSETAQNRKAKIDLANSQPPSISDMGAGANNGEVTEADIENMTEDQVADLLQKAPNLVQRIVGGAQNRG